MALVPGTSSDDIIIPTANGNTYLGGQGNDTYILTKAIAAGGTVIITDTEGANKIQLVDGLTIASSTFFADAAELTLSNGAKVQITGATKFAFDLGANLTAGDTATGTNLNQTYAQFAATLGVTTLPTNGSSAGTPNYTVPPDPVAATPLFTITGATTGAEGTSVTYTVKLSQAVTTGSTTVNYTTTFLNGASADDITGSGAGTLTFAANETTKTITIPLVADSNAETTKESIVVTLSAPSTGTALGAATAVTTEITEVPVTYTFTGSDAVFEGANATYTVTASRPVDVDTVVGFVVAPGDAMAVNAGTNKTNLADFDQGAFNTFTATILKGQTTATYTVSALADAVTELEETFSVTASMNGAVVGTKTTTLKDGNGSGGKIFTLTTGVDTGAAFTGTAGPDTFNAFSSGSAETLTTFDSIDGNAGNDTLNVVSAHNAAFTVPSTATVVNIENANITGDNTVSANVTKWTGLTKLNVAAVGGDAVSAATNVAITVTDNLGAGSTNVNGGSSVAVTATGVTTGAINVGATTAPTGAVTVNSTITSNTAAGTIAVRGGTTVDITQTAAHAVNTTATNGQVTVAGGASTTSVSVKSSAAAAASSTVAGVTANSVTIQDVNAGDDTKVGAITSISVDSYTTLSIADTALTSLSLAHGSGNIIIDNSGLTKNTNTTLAVSLDGVTGGTLDDADIYTTLNVTTGATKSTLSNITAGALTTLSLTGASGLTITSSAGLSALKTVTVSGAAGLTANLATPGTVTSVDTSASTGASTLTINASQAKFTGGEGVDKITLSSATLSKAIALGGGNDTLVLNAGTTLPTAAVSGGAGTDTLSMNADDAHTASGSASFAGVVTGFETLQLTALTTNADNTIDLAALGGYTNVTTGGIAIGAGKSLTLQNFASGGTLTLTADATTGSYALSNSAWAAGTNDTVNLVLNKAGLLAAGTIDMPNVENIVITTADTQATPTNPLDTVTITSTSAKSITVSGNAGLNLTDTAATLTSVDASGITAGSFTFTTGALTAAAAIKGSATGTNTVNFSAATGGAVTYTGGTGNDVINSSNGKNNVLTLGAGDNTVTGAAGNHTVTAGDGTDAVTLGAGNNTVTLGNGANAFTATNGNNTYTGGTGVDTVTVGGGMNSITVGTGADVVTISTASANLNTYTTVVDPHAGMKIGFATHGTEVFTAAKVVLANTAVFQDYADAVIAASGDGSVNGHLGWFQFNGDTYVVENQSGTHSTFSNGTDFVVKLTGLVDLSTATISGHALLLGS